MKHPVTRELYAYWDALRQGRAAPERADIDPAAIRGTLADAFILEVQGSSVGLREFPVRLSGTRMGALFLRELKGSSLLDWWRSEDQATLRELLACVLDDRAAMVAGARTAPQGHTPLDLELLLLPLRHHGKTHSRVLGSLAPSRPATWMGLLRAEPLSLLSFRRVGIAEEAAASFAGHRFPPPEPPSRRGRFLVYEGGR